MVKEMKFKYIYQQFISHISIIIVAFLILSLLFSYYVESLVYNNKAEELISYGRNILQDLNQNRNETDQILAEYNYVLAGRNIRFSLFDQNLNTSIGGYKVKIALSKEEWEKILNDIPIVVKNDAERFNQAVTFVLLPYFRDDIFLGGILLTSPISGSREMITEINRYLFYTVLIALVVSLLLSWILSKIHVNRVKRIQEATSLVAQGDYSVVLKGSNFDEIGELAEHFNKMVEKLRESKEEIERLEKRRRQFMADVTHELRTPLTTIKGVIDGLRNNMIPEEEKERGLQLVSQETKRLIRLVNEYLDYEKIRSNQIVLHKEAIQLIEVLEIIKDQLELLAEEKNNRIIVEGDEQIIVHADYDRLMQILINITKNSIQFTDNGIIWLRGKKGNNETIIEIEDTGVGIDPEEIDKIWQRFYKADLSRTTNPYGEFGLGLSIVKQLVQLHKGDIDVTSEKGKGTKFTIRFPCHA